MASQDEPQHGAAVSKGDEGETIIELPNGITIRELRQSDIPATVRHGNNQNIWDQLRNRMPHPYTEKDAEWWVDHCQNGETLVRSGNWTAETGSQGPLINTHYAICADDEAVGTIGLVFGEAADVYFRCAELGYWLSEEHWGKGIMSKAVPAFVDWAWRTFGILIRLNAEVHTGNIGSRKCLEKAGLEVEGTKKWAFVKNGVLKDNYYMGALRPDGGTDE